MTRPLEEYAREWEGNAAADPLYVILTDPARYGRAWDPAAFFATGEDEVARVFAWMAGAGVAAPSATGRFLDFGCGVGRISRALARRFAGGVGLDISARMVELARRNVPGVEFRVNVGPALAGVADASVDFVWSHIVLQHIPGEYQRGYLAEFCRVLRPGGLAVFQLPVEVLNPRVVRPPAWHRAKQWLKRRVPALLALKRLVVPPAAFHYEFRYEMHALPDAEVRAILARGGARVEAAPATNSCEPAHNGRVEFFDPAARRAELAAGGEPNRWLSVMYFARKGGAGTPGDAAGERA